MRLSFGPFAEHFVTIYFALLAFLAAFDAYLWLVVLFFVFLFILITYYSIY